MIQLGLTAIAVADVRVAIDSNRRQSVRQRQVSFSYQGKTIEQIGLTYRVWTGVLDFDTTAELATLRALADQREIYLDDDTDGGTGGTPILVYWRGPFLPDYSEPGADYGTVSFELEEVTSA